MLATSYAQHFNIPQQQEGESDLSLRSRVAGVLRAQGRIIEAHEAYHDERYENSDKVNQGVYGALAQALSGRDYSQDREQKIGDDIASGFVAKQPQPDAEMAVLAAILFGGGR